MPHDAVTIRRDVVQHKGLHDMVVETQYEAPASGEYVETAGGVQFGVADDPFKEKDLELARRVHTWLMVNYAGYPWLAKSDLRQGYVCFNIPILMGLNDWWIIILDRPGAGGFEESVIRGAGVILERYGLSRIKFNDGEFLDARERHSKLVDRHRKVPN